MTQAFLSPRIAKTFLFTLEWHDRRGRGANNGTSKVGRENLVSQNGIVGLSGIVTAFLVSTQISAQEEETPPQERSAAVLGDRPKPTFDVGYGGRHALVIGIDEYKDSAFQKLAHAVADASAFAEILETRYGFPQENIAIFKNSQATKPALERALEEWACEAKRVSKEDLFVIFFAGHGVTRPFEGGERGYLVPYDGRSDSISLQPSWSTLLGLHDLEEVSPIVPAKHVLFILDCCFGGLAVRRNVPPPLPGLDVPARQVLTAGTAGQEVFDGGGAGHSVFTAALLEGLRGAADENLDGAVTFGELYAHVNGWVVRATRNQQIPVQGTFPGHQGGNVTLFPPDLERRATAKQRLLMAELTAEDRLREFRLLADLVTTQDLHTEAEKLWPRRPDKIHDMRQWLAEARDLYSRLPEHDLAVDRAEREALAEQPDGIDWARAETWIRFRFQSFSQLVSANKKIGELIPDVDSRLQLAETIVAKTIDDYEDEWATALEAITEHPDYNGLELEPQVGLIPLEPDPESGLWEFLLWESGEGPERDAKGRYDIRAETGIVLVLVPAGTFTMGAQIDDPDGANYDPQAQSNEGPPNEVVLDVFFMSKYELTQGQYERITTKRPSFYPSPIRPVEQITWQDAQDVCEWYGLLLPTEVQWEYACRATTATPWSTGQEEGSLEGTANLFDSRTFAQHPDLTSLGTPVDWEDSFVTHAPGGTVRAQPVRASQYARQRWRMVSGCIRFLIRSGSCGSRRGTQARPRCWPPLHPRRRLPKHRAVRAWGLPPPGPARLSGRQPRRASLGQGNHD